MSFAELSVEEVEELDREALRAQAASLEADAEALQQAATTVGVDDFCPLYHGQLRPILRKTRNTLGHPLVKVIVGGKPARALDTVLGVLDSLCPR